MTTHSSGLVPTHIYTWLLTPLAWYTHTYIHDYSQSCIYVCGYQARGVSSHVYMCVGTKPEEWVVMYICLCGYQARGVSSHGLVPTHTYTSLLTPLAWYPHTYIHDYSLLWLGTGSIPTHIYTWLPTPLAWYRVDTDTHIYMTTHSSGLVLGRYPHTYIHDYSLLWLGTGSIPTHIYTWLPTPLAWYRVDTHTHIYMTTHWCGYRPCTKPEEWVVMYICVWVSTVYQARGVSSHVYMCVGIDPVPSQRSE
jgi:hypothetical protein